MVYFKPEHFDILIPVVVNTARVAALPKNGFDLVGAPAKPAWQLDAQGLTYF